MHKRYLISIHKHSTSVQKLANEVNSCIHRMLHWKLGRKNNIRIFAADRQNCQFFSAEIRIKLCSLFTENQKKKIRAFRKNILQLFIAAL